MSRQNVYRWNDWNDFHISKHGVSQQECEYVINRARAPWPEYVRDGKWRVWGHAEDGWMLQVVFVIDPDDAYYIIHARPLTESEKRQYRRRMR